MTKDIGALGERHPGADAPLPQWKAWQPPVTGPLEPAKLLSENGAAAVRTPRLSGDLRTTGQLNIKAAGPVNLNNLQVPEVGQNRPVARIEDHSRAVEKTGLPVAINRVATAMTKPMGGPELSTSLGRFASTMEKAATAIAAIPGATEALLAFGGVAGVVATAVGLKNELAAAKKKGADPAAAMGIAGKAAALVGGVALAMTPLCPALAPVGTALIAAGTALSMGKLAMANRDELQLAVATASVSRAHGPMSPMSRMVQRDEGVTPIVSNNGGS